MVERQFVTLRGMGSNPLISVFLYYFFIKDMAELADAVDSKSI